MHYKCIYVYRYQIDFYVASDLQRTQGPQLLYKVMNFKPVQSRHFVLSKSQEIPVVIVSAEVSTF